MQLKGLEESIYQRRNTYASKYSHQFCRKLCCDIMSQMRTRPHSRVQSGDAAGSQHTAAADRHQHTAYPAELDDDDLLPQTLPPISQSTPTDPIQQLRDLNTSTLRIGDTNIKQIVDILNQHSLKASIMTLIDFMTKFGLPGQPSSRLFVNPRQPGEPEHIAARTVIDTFKDFCTTHSMFLQTDPQLSHITRRRLKVTTRDVLSTSDVA